MSRCSRGRPDTVEAATRERRAPRLIRAAGEGAWWRRPSVRPPGRALRKRSKARSVAALVPSVPVSGAGWMSTASRRATASRPGMGTPIDALPIQRHHGPRRLAGPPRARGSSRPLKVGARASSAALLASSSSGRSSPGVTGRSAGCGELAPARRDALLVEDVATACGGRAERWTALRFAARTMTTIGCPSGAGRRVCSLVCEQPRARG